VVYRVRHVAIAGDLAIKVIKRGMDTAAVLHRFHNERRILETVRHPNIAALFDAGATPDGLPYFVMEHIDGKPIVQYCDDHRLPLDDRIRLFQKVCAAVQCAHEHRVVHRDIKPANILVTADGEPKLLDFGIAKVLDFTSPTGATITLTPVMTPHYASPEQAMGGRVTSASDVYSLGVLLYELLSGVSPYRPAEPGAPGLVHAICHERPQPPSTAIARLDQSDAATLSTAAARSANPASLRRSLSGDLDAIILTALDKQPNHRYRSVAEFSADLSRHLDGARVEARQFARRYSRLRPRVLWAVAAIVVLAIAALLAFNSRPVRLKMRPSVAVLGFENLSREPSAEWLSTALTEMLSTELASGGRLRTVPGELVARVKLELALPNAQTFTAPTLARLRDSLTADYVVLGSYLAVGEGPARQVRVDLRLQDTSNGEVVGTVSETHPAPDLIAFVSNAGSLLRRQLGAGNAAPADAVSVRGSVPESADAAKSYIEGLDRLRAFETLAARDLLRAAVSVAPRHAQSHAALAAADSLLGYDSEARDEAKKALDLSAGLRDEDRLSIEGRYFETSREWAKAVEIYRKLYEQYPDNLDYGLRLAAAETQAGDPRRALTTIQKLHDLPSSSRDPRLDLAQAEAAMAAAEMPAARAAASRAAQSAADQGRTL
jgi:serine/threonine protein kinase